MSIGATHNDRWALVQLPNLSIVLNEYYEEDRAARFDFSPGTITTLGQGQKPKSASGHARGLSQ
jgi:hypothetical protein